MREADRRREHPGEQRRATGEKERDGKEITTGVCVRTLSLNSEKHYEKHYFSL